jgi:aspartyl protease family protein
MIMRSLVFAVATAALASQIPTLLKLTEPAKPDAPAQNTKAEPMQVSATPGSVVLRADRRGHFNGSFRLNGRTVDGMVDTGASLIAINETTARKLGFGANRLDFRHIVNTANGRAEAAYVVLDRVEIGGVRVRDVDAFVMRDKALSSTLIGMSFMKKLKSYRVENGSLKLIQ